MSTNNKYGAVEVPAGNEHYDEGNTRYLNETPFQWGRFLRAAVPIFIALLIMGGFAYGMSHGFEHLYGPSKGGDESSNIKHDTSWIPEVKDVSEIKDTSAESPSDGGSRECAKHKNCASLGGNCCPTDDGIMLECCA